MNIYVIIYLALHVMGAGVTLAKDGQPKEGNYSFVYSLVGSGIVIWLLYKGGLFN